MEKFVFEKSLTKKGCEIIDAYQLYQSDATPEYVRDAIAVALSKERSAKVRTAIEQKVSVDEFADIVASQTQYLSGNAEEQQAALAFVERVVPAGTRIDAFKSGRTKIVIQKRIGLKPSDFRKYFGTKESETGVLFESGFTKTFVDLRIRKIVMDIINQCNSKDYEITVSRAERDYNRKLYNINIDFKLSVSNINDEIINEIVEIVRKIEEAGKDFTY